MSNKRHADCREGLPSAAVVLNKCMLFFFFYLLFTAICFIYFYFFMSPCDESRADTTGWLRSNNMPHPVFLPPSLSLALSRVVWVCKCVFGGDGGGGVGTQAVCLGSALVGEERDRRRKESPVCSFTLPVTQQNFREEFFFFVNNPPLFVSVLFAPYPLCPPFFSALRRCLFPSSLNIIVCVSLLNCFCM